MCIHLLPCSFLVEDHILISVSRTLWCMVLVMLLHDGFDATINSKGLQ